MFGNLKAKLMLLALLAALAIGALAGFGAWRLTTLGDVADANLAGANQASRAIMAIDAAGLAFKTQVQEWKNILLRGNDPALFDKHLKAFGEEQQRVRDELGKARSLAGAAGLDVARIDEALQQVGPLDQKYREALKGFDAADPEAGKKVDVAVRGMDRPLAEAMQKLVATAAKSHEQSAAAREAENRAAVRSTVALLLITAVVVALVMAALAYLISRSILRPALRLHDTICRVEANGDLAQRCGIAGGDELARCGVAFDRMLEHFQQIVRSLRTESERLLQALGAVSDSVDKVDQASTEQADATGSVSAAVEQLSVSIGHMLEAAREGGSLSRNTQELAQGGSAASATVAQDMETVAQRVTGMANTLEELGQRSEDISSIVATVKEIADQTNLLALNAAIEAARAGEQGRGFAVVADEVRKLAEKSTLATDQIARLIQEIQTSSTAAIRDIGEVVSQVTEQQSSTRRTTETMGDMRDAAEATRQAAERITDALGEQDAASQLIAQQVERIARISEENSASVRKVSHSTETLRELATRLSGAAARFSV